MKLFRYREFIKESFNLKDEELEDHLDNQEGFNSREDAKEYLDSQVQYYKGLGDEVTLYRILFISEDDELDENHLGDHWTPNIDSLLDPNWVNWIKDVNDASSEDKIYVIEATFKTSDIQWDWTIHTNLSFPNEEEIMVDKAKPIDYKVYKSIEEFKNRYQLMISQYHNSI